MIYSIKKESETNEKMILRYKKLFFQSRITNKIRANRYASSKPTKKQIRHSAIVRSHYRALNNKVYF